MLAAYGTQSGEVHELQLFSNDSQRFLILP